MKIRDIMKRPYVIDKDISLKDAAKIMEKKNIGSLIFVAKEKIKGIITERDILKNFGKKTNVSSVMTKSVVSIEPDESIENAVEIMRSKKIKRLPVVSEGRLIGIVTLTDIAAHYEALEGSFFFE
ncbi:MAG: CBS domain-containing protein [Candidatus Pacearchaeota archaeon]|nr:CBS domain-containing protein [Candidatus Pacearchaeota archaeon]